jgi:hypothetical protein
MTFEELSLLVEQSYRTITVVGNKGKPLTGQEIASGLDRYIQRKSGINASSIEFFLGKPNVPGKCFIKLIYQIEPSPDIPAKNFKYEIPANTLKKLREQPATTNWQKLTYLDRYMVFHLNGKSINKVFSESDLQKTMEDLIKVDNFFTTNYGAQYGFLGDVYTMGEGSTLSELGKSWKQNVANAKALPGLLKTFWGGLGS